MTEEPRSAGDPIPPSCRRIEVHVGELWQLFNAMDPAPFRERDLDPAADRLGAMPVRIVHKDDTRPGDPQVRH